MGACMTCVCTGPTGVALSVDDCPNADITRVLVSAPREQRSSVVEELAARLGLALNLLAPGLWELRGERAHRAVAALRAATSATGASQTRVLVAPSTATDRALLVGALAAPRLENLDARDHARQLRALFADEGSPFRSAYQPIVDLPQRRIVAYEALLRARTADGTELPPEPL